MGDPFMLSKDPYLFDDLKDLKRQVRTVETVTIGENRSGSEGRTYLIDAGQMQCDLPFDQDHYWKRFSFLPL